MSAQAFPRHVAIIMDGNGRWAVARGYPRVFGHIRGSSRAREVIREAARMGVKVLTLYAFSSENWGRPEGEVRVLMRLLKKWLKRRLVELMENGIRFRAIGNISKLPPDVVEIIRHTEAVSKNNKGMELVFALSYGAREEMTEAVQRIAEKVQGGELEPQKITADEISRNLWTANLGTLSDPDLLIRTSGEVRISNFMLWQIAYAELIFVDTMWPDFSPQEFRKALDLFSKRSRRFGLTSSQIIAENEFI